MSKVTKNRDQSGTGAKPAPKRKPTTKPRATRIKDPVERSEQYVANLAPAGHGDKILAGKARMNRLRELIEPHTEAMTQVMIDIALDKDHKTNPEKYKSIHPSIRLEAADRLMDRAYGKPKETLAIEDEVGVGGDEVMSLLNNIFDAVGLPKLEAPKEPGTEGPTES